MRFISLAAVAALVSAAPACAGTFHADVHGGWDRPSALGSSATGAAYGVSAGYDVALGEQLFVGIEGSADASSAKKCVGASGAFACIKAGRDLSAVARIGWKLSDMSRVYVLGGYANGRIKGTFDDGTTVTTIANGDGVRGGAGVELDFGSRLFGKLEYRYTNYQGDFSRNQVIVGFGVQF